MLTHEVGLAHAPHSAVERPHRVPHSANASAAYPVPAVPAAAHPESGAEPLGVLPEGTQRRWATPAEQAAFVEGAGAGAAGTGEAGNPYLVETASGWAWLCGLRWVRGGEG